MQRPEIICIVGPTASGKSSLAIEIAKDLDGEIISADSMQVYRHMDIGTAKPSLEEQGLIRHHLIDVIDPDENFSASDFRELASAAIKEIRSREKRVIIAGGTNLIIPAKPCRVTCTTIDHIRTVRTSEIILAHAVEFSSYIIETKQTGTAADHIILAQVAVHAVITTITFQVVVAVYITKFIRSIVILKDVEQEVISLNHEVR